MDITNKKIWQQASGEGRNYSEICLDWDVILNGPGKFGKFPECADNWGRSKKKFTEMTRFCSDMKEGDLVILRGGTSWVYGVGEVMGEYKWLDEFSDVDGWDLQHVRRVKWLFKSYNPIEFSTYDLKLGDTTQEINYNSPVINWLRELVIPPENYSRELTPLPNVNPNTVVDVREIADYLFHNGVASDSIENLLRELNELKRIATWYRNSQTPSEHETVTYLVVPILRALGWSPQKMAIEWNNIDVALFSVLPRENSNLKLVVEAKKMDESCLTAKSQAYTYVEGKSNCDRLIVTDGIRYGVFTKQGLQYNLHAYLNLTDLKREYPIYRCQGAKEALLALTPEWRA